jgi:hypothetical protein
MIGSRGQNSPQAYNIFLKITQKVGYTSINKVTTMVNNDI